MTAIALNLQAVRARIAAAAALCGRPASDIALLAVSKTFPRSYIEEAYSAGQRAFGESYAQEGVKKITALAHRDLDWHFIGPIQSNKTRLVAQHFDWAHTVDRLKIAQRLSEQRPPELGPLNICLQVNISGELSKSGVTPDELPALARQVALLPNLRLRGLMAIPEPETEFEKQRVAFRALRTLAHALRAQGIALDTLSMGMSADLEPAIAEGATCVRIGTAIFGARA